jgi:hypothetical protein
LQRRDAAARKSLNPIFLGEFESIGNVIASGANPVLCPVLMKGQKRSHDRLEVWNGDAPRLIEDD